MIGSGTRDSNDSLERPLKYEWGSIVVVAVVVVNVRNKRGYFL